MRSFLVILTVIVASLAQHAQAGVVVARAGIFGPRVVVAPRAVAVNAFAAPVVVRRGLFPLFAPRAVVVAPQAVFAPQVFAPRVFAAPAFVRPTFVVPQAFGVQSFGVQTFAAPACQSSGLFTVQSFSY